MSILFILSKKNVTSKMPASLQLSLPNPRFSTITIAMLTSYHTHTHWSDGRDDLAGMLDGARALGVDELGISDHYVRRPDGVPLDWSMPLDFLPEYVARMREAITASRAVTLRLGTEIDYFPETAEAVSALMARYPFDYLLGAVHFVDDFTVDENADVWEALPPDARDEMWRRYWERVRAMAECGFCDLVAHLDLPKKFGYFPAIDLTAEENAALDAIAAAGMAIELSTAGWVKPVGEAYPSARLLRAARRREIPLAITADAHSAAVLTQHFDRARALAHDAGYTELVGFNARERFTISL